MTFAEKLQLLRKGKGYTQEKLAEQLNVSRQAVAKWEAGMAYPDIANLIQISGLMHVSIDYLVKNQACSVSFTERESDDLGELIRFRLRANQNTYAAFMNEVNSSRLDSRDFHYEEGEFTYHDTYVGAQQFAGQEAIWKCGRAVYAMNYMGRVLGDTFSGDFLKEALRAADMDMPYRGPEYYQAGTYTYRCKVIGDFAWYQGEEEIICEGKRVYECRFHGGLLR